VSFPTDVFSVTAAADAFHASTAANIDKQRIERDRLDIMIAPNEE